MKCDPIIEEPSAARLPVAAEQRVIRETPIPSPEAMRASAALSRAASLTVSRAREAISAILRGDDRDRLLVICGPCSIDDADAALLYAEKLRELASRVEDKAQLVMRTYFEKPRSVVGWKGLLYDPLVSGEVAASDGISIARRLLVRVNEVGMSCATEFLNPLLALYIEDAIAYGSIGSRTVESQIHRELAGRLPMPVGMKNGMDGDPASALNAVQAASATHRSVAMNPQGVPCLMEVEGNPLAHVILRGGAKGPNFGAAAVAETVEGARQPGLARPVVVDCSHGNSQKDHRRQASVAREVLRQFKSGQSGIAGLMLESNLIEGRQDVGGNSSRRFGQSITDGCIGWAETEKIVLEIANSL